ncbi:MAG: FAD-dependent oxidoreductase [Myxococcales bacterium]
MLPRRDEPRPGAKPRILIVGGGPAGLSAGVHLLEAAGRDVDVEIVSMGHHLGGKASSWRDPEGYSIDHGFHAVFGFYEEMKSLARRAGVELHRALASSHGTFRWFYARSGAVDRFSFARNPLVMLHRYYDFPGLRESERRALVAASVRMAAAIGAAGDLEKLDDICYRAFLLDHGVPESVLRHPMFREVYELAFNAPHEISTYIVIHWARLAGDCYDDATFDYFAGGPGELFWDPIARYYSRLGGTLRVREKLVGLEHRDGKLVALRFAIPDNPRFHECGKLRWPVAVPVAVPVAAGTERREEGFAAVICTLPAACFQELNPGDELWRDPFFGNIRQLTSVSSLSLQLWTREAFPRGGEGMIATLPLPFGYAIDYKPMVPEFSSDPRYGAALEWVGAEDGYEQLSDEDLIRRARAGLSLARGFEGVAEATPVHTSLRRNRGNHQRYLLTDPGTLKFRPRVETPLRGLYLAGDWVRNEIDIPSMEGAIRSGKAAAKLVLERL